MTCERFNLPGGGYAIMCGRGRKRTPCGGCGKASGFLCDFPLSGAAAGKTCDKAFCKSCGGAVPDPVPLGFPKEGADFCRVHLAWLAEWRSKGGGVIRLPEDVRTYLAALITNARLYGLTTTADILDPFWNALDDDFRTNLLRVEHEVKRRFRAARRASKDPARGPSIGDPPARVYAAFYAALRRLARPNSDQRRVT